MSSLPFRVVAFFIVFALKSCFCVAWPLESLTAIKTISVSNEINAGKLVIQTKDIISVKSIDGAVFGCLFPETAVDQQFQHLLGHSQHIPRKIEFSYAAGGAPTKGIMENKITSVLLLHLVQVTDCHFEPSERTLVFSNDSNQEVTTTGFLVHAPIQSDNSIDAMKNWHRMLVVLDGKFANFVFNTRMQIRSVGGSQSRTYFPCTSSLDFEQTAYGHGGQYPVSMITYWLVTPEGEPTPAKDSSATDANVQL